MKTLYWLSIFGMLYGYVLFAFVLFSITKGKKYLGMKHRMLIELEGFASFLPYKNLLVAIISTIVFFTI